MFTIAEAVNFWEQLGQTLGQFAPQITVILASFLAIVGTRKQSAREYLAKSRSDSLNKTKDQFSEFVTVTYRIWGYKVYGATYQVSTEAIDRKNVAVLNLETSFNPNVEDHKKILALIKEIESKTMSLRGEIVSEEEKFGKMNQDNSDVIDHDIKPLMEQLKSEMQTYFYEEWEKIKSEIKYKK